MEILNFIESQRQGQGLTKADLCRAADVNQRFIDKSIFNNSDISIGKAERLLNALGFELAIRKAT